MLNFFGKEKKFGEIFKKKEKSFVTNIIIIKKKVHKSARRRRAFFFANVYAEQSSVKEFRECVRACMY